MTENIYTDCQSFLIHNVRIVEPGIRITTGDLLVRNGIIAAFGSVDASNLGKINCVDGNNRLLTPGLVDLHTHGILEYFYASGRQDMLHAGEVMGRFGVTSLLPTIVPQIYDGWLNKLKEIAETIPDVRGIYIPGLHLEGPFMAIKGTAAFTIPGDVELLEKIIDACQGRLSVMSLSPDTPNIIPVIKRLKEHNVAVFLTHTMASVEQTEEAIHFGAKHATHFYDVFYSPPEKDMGVRPVGAVETILADPKVTVDFIADGIHVHPMAIKAAVAAKGFRGINLITDSIIGAGLPPGLYNTPWGFQVRVRPADAPRTVEGNNLAGSCLTMNCGIRNLLNWLDLPHEQIWAMGTSNPADVLGLDNIGRVKVGSRADLVLWDDDFIPAQTWVQGETVFIRDGA